MSDTQKIREAFARIDLENTAAQAFAALQVKKRPSPLDWRSPDDVLKGIRHTINGVIDVVDRNGGLNPDDYRYFSGTGGIRSSLEYFDGVWEANVILDLGYDFVELDSSL